MLLIDAANVSGGGAVLLHYLAQKLIDKKLPFFILKKASTNLPVDSKYCANVNVNLVNREIILRRYIRQFTPTAILCFGNFPPPFRTGIYTITYFHNPHYVDDYDKLNFNWKHNLKIKLRKYYLRAILHQSNMFVVQTPHISRAFRKTYNVSESQIHILPFYNQEYIEQVAVDCKADNVHKQTDGFLYASSSEPHKNHMILLEAWNKLYQQNIKPTLYLTVSPDSSYTTPELLNRIDTLKKQGLSIQNLGSLSHTELLRKTYSCSACIFPSTNETLGLGLVEAYWMNNSILASRKPYLPYVLKPSADFDPHDPEEIAETVKRYLTDPLPKPILVISNKIDAFISLLYEKPIKADQPDSRAINYHSTIANEFSDKYDTSLGFQERFKVWTTLLEKYIKPDSEVLDLGCGSGIFSGYLGRKGCSIIGIDGSPTMIALCEQNRQSINEQYEVQRLPLSDPTIYPARDAVIASSLLEYLIDMPILLEQIRSIIKPGGVFIVSMPNRFSIWRRIEKLVYALTGQPVYFGLIQNVSDVDTFNGLLNQLGFDTLDTRFFSSFDPISRWLKYLLPEPLVNNLFVGVYRKR